jgi:hypothetical protein
MRPNHLVIAIGLFNSPKGDRAWCKVYVDHDTPLNEALDWARTRPHEDARKARKGERSIDKYADDIINSGNWAAYTELVQ